MSSRMDTPELRAAARLSSVSGIVNPAFSESLPDGSLALAYDAPNGKAYGLAFAGTAGPPSYDSASRSLERAIEAARAFLDGRRAHAERVAKRRIERTAYQTNLQVGTVLRSMWGYDQTNVDYYQVVEVSPSRKTVKIRPIAARSVDGEHYMTGSCWPLADHFTGPAKVHRVSQGDCVRLTSYSSASPWEPKADHWTAYA
jgi:hypothetical protein